MEQLVAYRVASGGISDWFGEQDRTRCFTDYTRYVVIQREDGDERERVVNIRPSSLWMNGGWRSLWKLSLTVLFIHYHYVGS